MDQADITFNNNVRTSEDTVEERTHTIIGDYWYTADLLDEYLSVSTSIHRQNARLALVTQLLTAAFDAHPTATVHDLYNDQNPSDDDDDQYRLADIEVRI